MSFSFAHYPPCPGLAPFVETVWMVRGHAPFDREAVLPNGVVELMVNFGPTQYVVAHGDRAVREDYRRAWVAGIQDEPLVIASPEGTDHLGIRFRPGGAHAVFGLPMDQLRDSVVELDAVLGAEAESLRDRLHAAAWGRARAEAAQRWLLERRLRVHPHFATVRRALDELERSSHALSVADLCERLGLSNRHLVQQFRRIVGLPPKAMARIARFHAVVAATAGAGPVDWADLAARFGYADQPHLVREFRRLAGVSPTQFLARRTPDEQHVIVS